MKTLMCGFTLSLGILASDVNAEINLVVDGEEIPLSTLMEGCKSMGGDPSAQIACFNALTQLIDEQAPEEPEVNASIPEAFDALRAVAEYQDGETGLMISGTDCDVQIVYFGNYYHISRRNVSSLDMFSVSFDASKLQLDQSIAVNSGQAPLSKATMTADATATTHGGWALESTQQKFAPRSPDATLDVYATEVIGQLSRQETQAFDFVLVHPQKAAASAEIWNAFEAYVSACQA